MNFPNIPKEIGKVLLGAGSLGIGIKLLQIILENPRIYSLFPYAIDASIVMAAGTYILLSVIKDNFFESE